MKLHHIASAIATVTLGLASFGAHAVVVNIDATSSGTSITLDAGTYTLSWVGIAGGGSYDGWQYKTDGTYRDSFTVTSGGVANTYDVVNGFAGFSTAADALAAFDAATSYVAYNTVYNSATGNYSYTQIASKNDPFTFTISSATTFTFGVPDTALSDNTGGVSLSIAAVPEPETYALMFGGLGMLAFLAKRRKAV